MAGVERNLRSMEGKVNNLSGEVAAQKNTTTNGLAALNYFNSELVALQNVTEKLVSVQAKVNSSLESVKEDIKTMKTELESHKTTVADELEALSTIDLKLDLLDSKLDKLDLIDSKQEIISLKQDRLGYRLTTVTSALEARILSNTTRELKVSSERHVTMIQSQMSSVNASIRNELRMVKRLLGSNSTECEIETTYSEDLLQSLLNSQTQLELRVLSNITKEMEMSADYHVTRFESALESKLSSVNDSIQNGLREIEEQIAKNCTASESNTLSSVADGIELGGGGQQNSSRQPEQCKVNSERTCETLNCSQPLEECTCDTSVEQRPAINLEEECKAYCDTDCPREVVLRNYTCGGSGGWRRVVFLNMTDPNTDCPIPWVTTSHSKRSCGRHSRSSLSCDSVLFSVSGGNYTSVCGSIRAYQYAGTDAFKAYHDRSVVTIERAYVSGISLTHGSPQQHIWTFAAGNSENQPTRNNVCPCDAPPNSISIPPFVGGDYFCESGVSSGTVITRLYVEDPLWDGQGCISSSTCCSFNNPPYFTKQLPSPTSDHIEARLCHYSPGSEDTPVEFMELYVK